MSMYDLIGQYPDNKDLQGLATEFQGVCHDNENWYFTQNGYLWKFPRTTNFYNGFYTSEDVRIDKNNNVNVLRRPSKIFKRASEGENMHLGDIDYYNGYIFVPLENKNNGTRSVRIYRASDLVLINEQRIKRYDGKYFTALAWLAINPNNGLLYTSDHNISQFELKGAEEGRSVGLQVYTIGDVTKPNPLKIHSVADIYDSQMKPVDIMYTQGGCFDEENHIYIVNGDARGTHANENGGISVFKVSSCPSKDAHDKLTRLDHSTQRGHFRYQFDGLWNEPEGITYWDVDKFISNKTPGIQGQLHAIVLNNGITDKICFKHYRCTWLPLPGNVKITKYADLPNQTIEIELVNMRVNTTVQWQRSTDKVNWTDFRTPFSLKYTTTNEDKNHYVRAKVTADGYTGARYSEACFINPERISGYVRIVGDNKESYAGSGIVKGAGDILEFKLINTPPKIWVEWERSRDKKTWTFVERISDAYCGDYYSKASDEQYYFRAKVGAYGGSGYGGVLYSNECHIIKKLSGKISYTSSICCGNPISTGLSGEISKLPKEILHYHWELKTLIDDTWIPIPYEYKHTFTPQEEYKGQHIHLRIDADGYAGSVCSDEAVVNPMPELTGGIEFTSYIVECGKEVKARLIGNVQRVQSNKLHYQWQINSSSNNNVDEKDFADIPNENKSTYIPKITDAGKVIRVVLTADGRKGDIKSIGVRVSRPQNPQTVTVPQLAVKSPYTTIEVINAKADQEYVISDSASAPENWDKATYPLKDGSLSLNCQRGVTVYVHTRFKVSSSQADENKSTYNSAYIPDPNYLNNLTLNYNSTELKFGDVLKLEVSPYPEDFKSWNDSCTVKWFINGYGVVLYADYECTKPITLSTPISDKTVYVKCTAKCDSVTVGVEKQVGLSSIYVANCLIRIK